MPMSHVFLSVYVCVRESGFLNDYVEYNVNGFYSLPFRHYEKLTKVLHIYRGGFSPVHCIAKTTYFTKCTQGKYSKA